MSYFWLFTQLLPKLQFTPASWCLLSTFTPNQLHLSLVYLLLCSTFNTATLHFLSNCLFMLFWAFQPSFLPWVFLKTLPIFDLHSTCFLWVTLFLFACLSWLMFLLSGVWWVFFHHILYKTLASFLELDSASASPTVYLSIWSVTTVCSQNCFCLPDYTLSSHLSG